MTQSGLGFRQIVGVPPSTASVSDSTLVIIDAQYEYREGKLAISGVEQSGQAIVALLQAYRAAHGSVVHVVHDAGAGAPVFTPGTKLADEWDELTPQAGEPVVHKNHPGSFTDTTLQEHLDAAGHKKVVLVGYQTHVCVSTTTRQAAERGYDTLVVEDAIGTRDIPGASADLVQKVVLAELGDTFATIVSSKDIARE